MTEELLDLERGFWDAAGEGDFYEEHMADTGLCVLPVGVLDKEATVSAIAEADPWERYEFSAVKTIDLGEDETPLCYRAEDSRDGDHYRALISSVYTRVQGDWKLALHQQTPIAG